MRKLSVIISVLLFAIISNAQQKCELTLTQAPTLQNLKLEMSPSEANNALGKSLKVKVKPQGQQTFFKNYINKKAKGNLTGIRAIFLRFYEGKLYQIELFYEQDYRWQNLEDLLKDYSARNDFPVNFWQTEYGYASANCTGFSLNADYILNPHIQITNDATAEIVEVEREEKEKN
jgi:hypothetical protein